MATPVNAPETLRADTDLNITSFGESENGELYPVTAAGERLPGPRLLTRARALSSSGWAPACPCRYRRCRAAARRGQDRLDLGGRPGRVERRADDAG